MPLMTPEALFASIKGGGLFVSRGGKYYFIPLADFVNFELPEAFQNGATDISSEYFKKVNLSRPQMAGREPKNVFNGIREALADFRLRDGFEAAAWIEASLDNFSRAEDSNAVLFEYTVNETPTKIVVDMSKGGKPSRED